MFFEEQVAETLCRNESTVVTETKDVQAAEL